MRFDELSRIQQLVVGAVALIVVVALISAVGDAIRLRGELRQAKDETRRAQSDARDALAAAAEVAAKLKARNDDLKQLEEKRSEDVQKYARASRDVRDLRSRYDLAVRERVSAGEAEIGKLCRDLESLGYPCDAVGDSAGK